DPGDLARVVPPARDLVAPGEDRGGVGSPGVGQARRVPRQGADRGGAQQPLGGHAGPGRALAAHRHGLDERDGQAGPRGADRCALPHRIAADHHDVERLLGNSHVAMVSPLGPSRQARHPPRQVAIRCDRPLCISDIRLRVLDVSSIYMRSGRENLLAAARTLLAERPDHEPTTRELYEAAGVSAPTLYHHFGDKDGLVEAAVDEAFAAYLERKRAVPSTGDLVADFEAGWDMHVTFGVENPALYAVMFGRTSGRRARAARVAEEELRASLVRLDDAGLLVVG